MNAKDIDILKLFQTEYHRKIEEEFASMLTERNDIRVFFINENEAYTDGINIVVDPCMDNLYCDCLALINTENYMGLPPSLSQDKFAALKMITRGLNIHESLHIIYSNFPSGVVKDKRATSKFNKMVLCSISNIIEDAFIETAGASEYDNIRLFLEFNRVARLFAQTPSEGTIQRKFQDYKVPARSNPAKEEAMGLLMEYLDYFVTMLLYPMVKLERPSGKLEPYINATKDLFQEASVCGIADERYQYVDKIFDLITDFIPDVQEESIKEYEALNKMITDIVGNEKTHSGTKMSINHYEHQGKNAAITRRLFTDLAGEPIKDDVLDQYLYELQKFKAEKAISEKEKNAAPQIITYTGKDLNTSPMHKDINIKITKLIGDVRLKKAYDNIYHQYQMNINSYRSRFVQLLSGKVEQNESGYLFGNGIASKQLGDAKKRFWYRKVKGIDIPDIAFLFMMDGSGSMQGEKNKNAMIASVILHEVLGKQGIEHAIVEHRAQFGQPIVEHQILVDFNHSPKEQYNILKLSAHGGTREGLSLMWAGKYLNENARAEHKVIISVSDGFPYHFANDEDEYEPPVSTKDTRNAVKKLEKIGIHVIAVALEDNPEDCACYEALKEIYDRIIDVKNLKKLPVQLLTIVSKLLS